MAKMINQPHSGSEGGVVGQTGPSGARQTGNASITLPVEGASSGFAAARSKTEGFAESGASSGFAAARSKTEGFAESTTRAPGVDTSVKSLLEAGVHFGHQVSRWNPKMRPYIFTSRNGIHIIDLEQTIPLLDRAYRFVVDQVARGASVLFVGTKKQAEEIVCAEAERVGAYYVKHRWLGGMLTNFKTIKQSIDRLKGMCQRRDTGELEKLPKKEALMIQREIEKLERTLGGIKEMEQVPGVVFLVDPKKEHIAQKEANRLHIPVVALADSNCDPSGIDYLIPGNDDAIRAIQLVVNHIADAVAAGMEKRQVVIREEVQAKEAKGAAGRIEERKVSGRGRAFVSKPEAFVEGEPVVETPTVPTTH